MTPHSMFAQRLVALSIAMALVVTSVPLSVWADQSATVCPPATRGGRDEDEQALADDLYGGPIGFEAKRLGVPDILGGVSDAELGARQAETADQRAVGDARNFRSLDTLLQALQTRAPPQPGEATDAVRDIASYPRRYGKHALYYLLRDLQQVGYRVNRSDTFDLQRLRRSLNTALDGSGVSYDLAQLQPALFWAAMERWRAAADDEEPFARYQGVAGMLQLAQALAGLVRPGQKAPHLSVLFDTFGSKK